MSKVIGVRVPEQEYENFEELIKKIKQKLQRKGIKLKNRYEVIKFCLEYFLSSKEKIIVEKARTTKKEDDVSKMPDVVIEPKAIDKIRDILINAGFRTYAWAIKDNDGYLSLQIPYARYGEAGYKKIRDLRYLLRQIGFHFDWNEYQYVYIYDESKVDKRQFEFKKPETVEEKEKKYAFYRRHKNKEYWRDSKGIYHKIENGEEYIFKDGRWQKISLNYIQ